MKKEVARKKIIDAWHDISLVERAFDDPKVKVKAHKVTLACGELYSAIVEFKEKK